MKAMKTILCAGLLLTTAAALAMADTTGGAFDATTRATGGLGATMDDTTDNTMNNMDDVTASAYGATADTAQFGTGAMAGLYGGEVGQDIRRFPRGGFLGRNFTTMDRTGLGTDTGTDMGTDTGAGTDMGTGTTGSY